LEKNCKRKNRRRIVEIFGECRPWSVYTFHQKQSKNIPARPLKQQIVS
jgi:hypothetical protein